MIQAAAKPPIRRKSGFTDDDIHAVMFEEINRHSITDTSVEGWRILDKNTKKRD